MKSVIIALDLQEILEEILSNNRHDRFRMELNALRWEVTMTQAHHHAVLSFGADLETRRNLGHHQRVIACGRKSLRQAGEQAFAVMEDFADLAVHQRGSAEDLSAKHLANCLMAETHTKYRPGLVKESNNVFRDPGIGRHPRSRGDHDPLGFQALDLFQCDLVVPEYAQFFTQLAEILHEVVGEGIVIIDNDNHKTLKEARSQKPGARIAKRMVGPYPSGFWLLASGFPSNSNPF